MGIRQVQKIFDLKEIGATRKLLLIYLAIRMKDDDDECWPSRQKIADDVGLSLRRTQDGLKWLADNGYITRISGKTGHCTRYLWGRKVNLAQRDKSSSPKVSTTYSKVYTGISTNDIPDMNQRWKLNLSDATMTGIRSEDIWFLAERNSLRPSRVRDVISMLARKISGGEAKKYRLLGKAASNWCRGESRRFGTDDPDLVKDFINSEKEIVEYDPTAADEVIGRSSD